ncbi:MAG: D-tyrosyl-tRNA(Tyr) deacylase [Desulfovibrionales bacterium]|nr:D-tyrosyl-tRNA(Tyr) deacylase [Desulfovibrionales bacterium]
MRAVLQRVRQAQVKVAGKIVASIGPGYVLLIGFGRDDHPAMVGGPVWNRFLKKILDLRLFPDDSGPINQSLEDQDGAILVVSQFTLYADIKKGRRPSFSKAARPEEAKTMYHAFIADLTKLWPKVEQGIFGADMDIELTNWGPVTIWIDSQEL